ncbi:hypothetical protein HK405_004930, partial [Cladochytrium tenue]
MDPKMDTGIDVERSPKHDREMIADLVQRLTFFMSSMATRPFGLTAAAMRASTR